MLAAAGFVMAPPTAASGQAAAGRAATFVHSSESGQFGGGRLVLRGVSGRVTWVTGDGRSGVVSIKRLHTRLFLPSTPVTGVLHVTGYRGGDEPVFRLSQPRYNAARQTVSYRAERLNNRSLPRRAAQAAQSSTPGRFGPASLSMAGGTTVGATSGGNPCVTGVTYNYTSEPFTLTPSSYSEWDTDSWGVTPNVGTTIFGSATWESDGGVLRGCGDSVVIEVSPNLAGYAATLTISTIWPWGQGASGTCTSDNPKISCTQVSDSPITWQVEGAGF